MEGAISEPAGATPVNGVNSPGETAPKTWRDVAKPIPLLLGVAVTAVATIVQLQSTYDGFFWDAIGSWASWVLIGLNALIAIGLMLALAGVFKPRNVLLYALTIALTWQAIIATDLAVEPVGGTDQIGEGQKLNVGFLHTELEKILSGEIDDPVEDAKRREIQQLRALYPTPDKLSLLRRNMVENLRTDGSVDDAERTTVLTLFDGVVADDSLDHDAKVREIALAVYGAVGRDPVRDLLPRT